VKAGKLKVLATGGSRRLPDFPDIPAISEQVPGFLSETWMGMVAPPKTPPELAARIAAAVGEAVREPSTQKRIADMKLDPVAQGPAQMAEVLRQESARWKSVIEQAKIRVD